MGGDGIFASISRATQSTTSSPFLLAPTRSLPSSTGKGWGLRVPQSSPRNSLTSIPLAFRLAHVLASPFWTWTPRTRACCARPSRATGKPPMWWRLAAGITPITAMVASGGTSDRGDGTFPLMFSVGVMPLVRRQWQRRDHTKSFTAASMTSRVFLRFTSCSTSYVSQYRRAIAINHCFA